MNRRGRKPAKPNFIWENKLLWNLVLFKGEMGLRASLGTPYSKPQTGVHTGLTELCIRNDFAKYFHCLRELCNEWSLDLTEASQGIQSWHSFQIHDMTSCLGGTGSIYGGLHLTGKIMSWDRLLEVGSCQLKENLNSLQCRVQRLPQTFKHSRHIKSIASFGMDE